MAQPSILVLEDDEIIRALMVDVLEDFGAVVTSFPSADEGMIYLERGDDPVDLIVSDIQMPGLLNGYDLSRVVAHRWPASLGRSGCCGSGRVRRLRACLALAASW